MRKLLSELKSNTEKYSNDTDKDLELKVKLIEDKKN